MTFKNLSHTMARIMAHGGLSGRTALSAVALLAASSAMLAGDLRTPLTSPNGKVAWTAGGGAARPAAFGIAYGGGHGGGAATPVLSITGYGVLTKDGGGRNLALVGVSEPRRISERYRMLAGKRRDCSNEANEVVYTFADGLGRKQRMVVRLYDDGVAFRYELEGLQHTAVTQDLTTYHIAEGTRRWMQEWTESYENFFPLGTTGRGGSRHWGYPALIQAGTAGGAARVADPHQPDVFALITEAGVGRANSASSLKNSQSPEDYRVFMDENTQHYSGAWSTPWRVVIVGRLRDIVASTLVTDVSEPCRLKDTSWIRPGSVSWIYWAYNHGSNDLGIIKKYVDMAQALRLPYVLIDAEWDEMKNGATIADALQYVRDRGVRPLLWYNSSTAWVKAWGAPGPHERLNAPESREREFAWLERMGVAGVKIDFFAGDRQETMEYCIDLLECAARHHLTVNFHGATVPRGWQRTYPNLLSTEGVYGAEWYNNKPVLTGRAACHNATLPFTRGVIGSMDYTPCTFSDSQHPHITTHAHELALPVLFESALMHWADRPESYLSQPEEVRRFISDLPTAWDETRLLSGYPGESAVMARRRGGQWYVAGINGRDEAQTIAVDWSFLGAPRRKATLFEDGQSARSWKIATMPSGRLPRRITMQPRGGFVLVAR